jgi:hypothetical protein
MQDETGSIAGELIAAARHTLSEGMPKIEHCVNQLSHEQLWWRPRPEMNSIANLMLHLSGNVRQWVINGVTGAPDTRNRPREFGDRSNKPKAEVLAILQATVKDADEVLASLDAEKLVAQRQIQGWDVSVIKAMFDSIAHFRGHVQEIIHMTREQLGEKYQFDFVPKGPEQISAFGGMTNRE